MFFEKLSALDEKIMSSLKERYLNEYESDIEADPNKRATSAEDVVKYWENEEDALKTAILAKDNFKMIGNFSSDNSRALAIS